jgi:hypothetical protein
MLCGCLLGLQDKSHTFPALCPRGFLKWGELAPLALIEGLQRQGAKWMFPTRLVLPKSHGKDEVVPMATGAGEETMG